MDALALLKLQLDWGADEALDLLPRDRHAPAVAAPPAPVPTPGPTAPVVVAGRSLVAQAAALAEAADRLETLRAALAGFTDCPLQPTAMHLVFLDGNPAAGLMLIGDAPGEDEDRTGRPFSGPGGKLLDRMLASIGLDRDHATLAHAIPWRPPGNRKPSDLERALCLPFLHRQIALLRPRRLVLLGGFAAATVLGMPASALRRVRGTWQEATIAGLDRPVPALPTLSPDQLIATPASKREAWADLLALRLALDGDADRAE